MSPGVLVRCLLLHMGKRVEQREYVFWFKNFLVYWYGFGIKSEDLKVFFPVTNYPSLRILSLSLSRCPWGGFGVTQISEKLSSPEKCCRCEILRSSGGARNATARYGNPTFLFGVRYWWEEVGGPLRGRGTRNADLQAEKVTSRPSQSNLRLLVQTTCELFSWQSLLAAGTTQEGAICTDTGGTSRGPEDQLDQQDPCSHLRRTSRTPARGLEEQGDPCSHGHYMAAAGWLARERTRQPDVARDHIYTHIQIDRTRTMKWQQIRGSMAH